jgi:hypothetical protein
MKSVFFLAEVLVASRRLLMSMQSVWELEEVNFTFEGNKIIRERGIRVLNLEELEKGDVSLSYVSKLLNRTYTETPVFYKRLDGVEPVIEHPHFGGTGTRLIRKNGEKAIAKRFARSFA